MPSSTSSTILLPNKELSLAEKKSLILQAEEGLGIYIPDHVRIDNPLLRTPEELEECPELYYIWLLSQPEYFWFTCRELFNVKLAPFQSTILKELWNHKFPLFVGSRGLGKSFLLAIYCLLRLLFLKNRKIVICGSAFRQSQLVFQYMENIVNNSKILRNLIPQDNITHGTTAWKMTFQNSECLAVPIGHSGESIRGLRANDIIADEFAAQNVEVFETVIAGFASVNSDPTSKAAKNLANKMRKILGFEIDADPEGERGNQIIISGTAYYAFNHFAKYHERYRKIIKSRGNPQKLAEIGIEEPGNLNYKDYCVVRLPVTLLPTDYMDESQITRARSTVHSSIYMNEYLSCFAADSDGFFKRTLIEACTVREGKDMDRPEGESLKYSDIAFDVRLSGNPQKAYVMGVDPAMMKDNFSIVILEVSESHRSVVYCWTTNNKEHKEKLKNGTIKENNYYAYCAKKIRNLMARFNIIEIAIDWGGGGGALIESLNDKNLMGPNDISLWPKITDKPKETDYQPGSHIIDVIHFSKNNWPSEANHGLRTDMEKKRLLFPFFDGLSLIELDSKLTTTDVEDTYDIIVKEIEELKEELTTIVLTQTPSGKEHFDTPEIKTDNRKGRMKKDRYSALLMANKSARDLDNALHYELEAVGGGFATDKKDDRDPEVPNYKGPYYIASKLNDLWS